MIGGPKKGIIAPIPNVPPIIAVKISVVTG
jgi:hypothetical protein